MQSSNYYLMLRFHLLFFAYVWIQLLPKIVLGNILLCFDKYVRIQDVHYTFHFDTLEDTRCYLTGC